MKSTWSCSFAILATFALSACADSRTLRDDDVATAMYRDCMNAAPGMMDAHDVSSAVSGSAASVTAAAERNRDQRQQMDCMQQAGYEDD